MTTNKNGEPGSGPALQGAEHMGVGMQFIATLLLFIFGGRWLDGRFGTEPWLLLGGLLFGFVGSMYWMYRQLATLPRARANARDGETAAQTTKGEDT